MISQKGNAIFEDFKDEFKGQEELPRKYKTIIPGEAIKPHVHLPRSKPVTLCHKKGKGKGIRTAPDQNASNEAYTMDLKYAHRRKGK